MEPRRIPVTFEKGIVDRYSPSMLGPGEHQEIVNWVPEGNGELRMRQHWVSETDTGLGAVRRGRGLHKHAFAVDDRYLVAASAKDANTTQVWTWIGGIGVNEVQSVPLYNTQNGKFWGPSGGTFTLSWDSGLGVDTTAAIAVGTDGVEWETVANAQAAVDAVWGAGEITVSSFRERYPASPWWSYNNRYRFQLRFHFDGPTYGLQDISNLFSLDSSGLTGDHMTNLDDAWVVTQGAAAGYVSIQIGGYAATVPVAAYDADPDVTMNAVMDALATVDPDLADASVSSELGGINGEKFAMTVTWDGALAAQSVPLATITPTGGGPDFTVKDPKYSAGVSDIWALDEQSATWRYLGEVLAPAPTQQGIVSFASGADLLAALSPGSSLYTWDGKTWTDKGWAAQWPAAAQCLTYHKSRFFAGVDTTLWFSQLLSIDYWFDDVSGTDNSIPISALDGEQIETLQTHEDLLFIGKRNSIWMMSGSSAATFALRRMVGGGCAPGRTLVPTPFGLVAIGRETVWLYTGGPWREISENIRGSYGMTGAYMTGAYCSGSVYICDEGTGTIWVYNFDTGAWSTEERVSDEGPKIVYAYADMLYAQPQDGTVNSIAMRRQMPTGERRRDENSTQRMVATTGEMWVGNTVGPATIRQLSLRLRQNFGDSSDGPLIITPTVDGQQRTPFAIQPRNSPPQAWRDRMSLGGTGYAVSFTFEQLLGATEEGGIEIEQAILEVDVEEPR